MMGDYKSHYKNLTVSFKNPTDSEYGFEMHF